MSFPPGTQQPPQGGPTQPVAPPMRGARYIGAGSQGRPSGPGRPGGPTALAGCVPAAPGRRSAAALVDGLVSASPAVVATVAVQVGSAKELPGLVVVGVVLSLAWLVGVVVVGLRFAQTGVSPGKRAMGLRLVDVRTGGTPGLVAWGRFALAGAGGAVLLGWVLAVAQILTNKGGERRAWYDTLTHLVLLDVEAGRDPFLTFAGGPAISSFPRPRGAATGGSGAPRPEGSSWAGPAISTVVPGLPGVQSGPQGPGGVTLPAGPIPGGPIPAAPIPGAPIPGGPIPIGTVSAPPSRADRTLAPVPPPPPVVAPPPAPAGVPAGSPAAPVPPPPPPVAPPPADAGVPASSSAAPVPAAPVPAAPVPAAPTAPVTAARALFTFTSGQVHEATGSGVIGRAPRPTRTGAMPVIDPGVLPVTDVTRTVSKAHLAFEVEASGVWVTDLGSTNGSTVIGARGVPMPLVPGAAVLAAYGSTVTVGELSFTLASVPALPEEGDDVEFTIQRDHR